MKTALQKFGKFLSAMVMPNIGAFIAWGFITALFIETGWLPNEGFASIQPFMLSYLLPILIAAQGGKMVAGERGRIMGAIAVTGCIAGAVGTPMLMGAMVMGPLAGWVIKQFDRAIDGKQPAGFEMLINNFSVGIIGMLLAMLGYVAIGPFMAAILSLLAAGVQVLVDHSLLPLAAIFIEPAKVLFLNNAINHGVFTPIATIQAAEAGKSIMFMLETNPGPGLGVLIAYALFAKDEMTKSSAPGAIIIHFFGGIHEIYFPYILMNPVVIVAPIVGNIVAIFFYLVTDCGLVGAPSPGSIIAFTMMSPPSQVVLTWLGVIIAAAISFVIATPIIKMSGAKNLDDAQAEVAAMKAKAKGIVVSGPQKNPSEVKKIVFACDAGMGSSAMGATKFRNRVKAVRPDVTVLNTSVDNIPADCDIAVVQTTLVERAKKSAPQAQMVTIGNFLADPKLDALYIQLTTGDTAVTNVTDEDEAPLAHLPSSVATSKKVLVKDGLKLSQKSVSKEEAIQAAGELLVKLGYVDASYIDAMQEREKLVTTYMGMGVAIPHGTTQAKGTVKKTGIVLLQYPDGVQFGDEKAQLVFGIAGIGDEHLDLLGKICDTLEDEVTLEVMKTTNDADWILKQLS